MGKLVMYVGWALLGIFVGIGVKSAQDAKLLGTDFWTTFHDRLMRILGWW